MANIALNFHGAHATQLSPQNFLIKKTFDKWTL